MKFGLYVLKTHWISWKTLRTQFQHARLLHPLHTVLAGCPAFLYLIQAEMVQQNIYLFSLVWQQQKAKCQFLSIRRLLGWLAALQYYRKLQASS